MDIPYITRLSDEIKIYEKDYGPNRVQGKHIAPHTIEMAAMWAVLTRARGDAERELAEATALVQRAEARLAAPDAARLPRRVLTPVQASVDTAKTTLQEARAALEQEEYERVGKAAATVTTQIEAALLTLDPPAAAPARGRKR